MHHGVKSPMPLPLSPCPSTFFFLGASSQPSPCTEYCSATTQNSSAYMYILRTYPCIYLQYEIFESTIPSGVSLSITRHLHALLCMYCTVHTRYILQYTL